MSLSLGTFQWNYLHCHPFCLLRNPLPVYHFPGSCQPALCCPQWALMLKHCHWSCTAARCHQGLLLFECSCIPKDASCTICDESKATIRCKSCGYQQFYCYPCAMDIHKNRNYLHCLEEWKVMMCLPTVILSVKPCRKIISFCSLAYQCSGKSKR